MLAINNHQCLKNHFFILCNQAKCRDLTRWTSTWLRGEGTIQRNLFLQLKYLNQYGDFLELTLFLAGYWRKISIWRMSAIRRDPRMTKTQVGSAKTSTLTSLWVAILCCCKWFFCPLSHVAKVQLLGFENDAVKCRRRYSTRRDRQLQSLGFDQFFILSRRSHDSYCLYLAMLNA